MVGHELIKPIDRLLREIMDNPDSLFGGKVVIFGGDWSQILPIVPLATLDQTMNYTLKKWVNSRYVQPHSLTQNLRTGPGQQVFSDWLYKLGKGQLDSECRHKYYTTNHIDAPDSCIIDDIEQLITNFYGSAPIDPQNMGDLSEKGILCTRNCDALDIMTLW